MYEELRERALKEETDITGCATMTDFSDGRSKNYCLRIESGLISAETCVGNILYGTQVWGSVWNKIFKARLFDSVRFPEGKQLEDYVLIMKLFRDANAIYFHQKALYRYCS